MCLFAKCAFNQQPLNSTILFILLCDTANSIVHSKQCLLTYNILVPVYLTFSKIQPLHSNLKREKWISVKKLERERKLYNLLSNLCRTILSTWRRTMTINALIIGTPNYTPFQEKSLWYIRNVERRIKWGSVIIFCRCIK